MELLEIESCRVTHLTQIRRPAGQLYTPEAAAKLLARYSFIKHPRVEDLIERRDFLSFGVGKFADTQIQEFRIYNDGFTVDARSNSKILDAFVDDVLEWGTKEFGLEVVPTATVERHYDSSLIVRSNSNVSKLLAPLAAVSGELNRLLEKSSFKARQFLPTGFLLGVDPSAEGSKRREPMFLLDRRTGVPFSENTYYSQAALPTDDHLALLKRIETLAR